MKAIHFMIVFIKISRAIKKEIIHKLSGIACFRYTKKAQTVTNQLLYQLS